MEVLRYAVAEVNPERLGEILEFLGRIEETSQLFVHDCWKIRVL
jgi:hypothetical protein